MLIKSRISMLFFVLTIMLTTCSATLGQNDIPQTATPTLYLPMVTSRYPYPTLFGVDGDGSYGLMKSAGAYWLRVNSQLYWSEVEAVKGVYDWSKAAQVEGRLIDAAQSGLESILLIQDAPVWARKYPDSRCGPIKEQEWGTYANFVEAAVQRYSQAPYNVRYFQIWNEPDGLTNNTMYNHGCWADGSDEFGGGRAYGRLLNQIYPRIKAINSNAQVLLGSLMMLCDPRETNPQNYCADEAFRKAANFFEGVMIEAPNAFDIAQFNSGPSYAENKNPVWQEMNNWRWKVERGGLVNGKIGYLRAMMAKYGVDKPIMHSEAYLLDRPADVNSETYLAQFEEFEEQKSDYLVWVFANGWSQGLKAVTWYSVEGWKGSELVSAGQPVRAYDAFKNMTSLIQFSEYVSREDHPSGYSRFVFRTGSEDIWLLIPTGETFQANYALPKPATFRRAVDVYGVTQTVSGSTINFMRPLYVIVGR